MNLFTLFGGILRAYGAYDDCVVYGALYSGRDGNDMVDIPSCGS